MKLDTEKTSVAVRSALAALSSLEKAKNSAWFFKTGPGQYGEGDTFIGVTVPEQRKIAKQYRDLPLNQVVELLRSPIHEHRLTALFILVWQYQRGDANTKKLVASQYHKNRAYVNNWDLVDSSAPYILGDYLANHSRNVLLRLAKSRSIWDRRIAILATSPWIRAGDFTWTLKLAKLLIADQHDLMHKAVGWMLREVGNKDRKTLEKFLDDHAETMPRTMLRYAIEKFEPNARKRYLSIKKVS